MAKIIFDDSTDYDAVYVIVKRMFAKANSYSINNKVTHKVKDTLLEVASIDQNVAWDKTNNVERYEDDVRAMYNLLYPLTDD